MSPVSGKFDNTNSPARKRLPGRVKFGIALSIVAILFLALDAIGKLMQVAPVMSASIALGYPPGSVLPIGMLLALGVLLYAWPRTMLIGAIYLTGYLGGAIATHVRVESPLLTHTLFAVYVAAFIWAGALLRNGAMRAILLDARGK